MNEEEEQTLKTDVEALKNMHLRPVMSVWSDWRLWGVCFAAIAVAEVLELVV